jgi:hypothetical protein
MNEDDLRDFLAGLAMLGGVIRNGAMHKYIADDAYAMADHMLVSRIRPAEEEAGITTIKPKRKKAAE